jgi:signal transduction histidine kinase
MFRRQTSSILDHWSFLFESLWHKAKHIIFNFQSQLYLIIGFIDLDKLEKIITNLLANAFKFTPENGRITKSDDAFESKYQLPSKITEL